MGSNSRRRVGRAREAAQQWRFLDHRRELQQNALDPNPALRCDRLLRYATPGLSGGNPATVARASVQGANGSSGGMFGAIEFGLHPMGLGLSAPEPSADRG